MCKYTLLNISEYSFDVLSMHFGFRKITNDAHRVEG